MFCGAKRLILSDMSPPVANSRNKKNIKMEYKKDVNVAVVGGEVGKLTVTIHNRL